MFNKIKSLIKKSHPHVHSYLSVPGKVPTIECECGDTITLPVENGAVLISDKCGNTGIQVVFRKKHRYVILKTFDNGTTWKELRASELKPDNPHHFHY